MGGALALGLLWLARLVAASVLAVLLYLVVNPINRWKYRSIPGPPYRAIFGNLPEFRTYGSHEFMVACRAKYGPVFKVWFGHRVWVIVCDPDLGKRVNYKCINRPRSMGDPLMKGPVAKDENKGLFFSRDGMWRLLHKVWQPTFYADSVHACAPLMSSTTQRMVARLEVLADQGQAVDIWREVGKLTMAIVGTAAYGIDFHTIDDPADEHSSSATAAVPLAAPSKPPPAAPTNLPASTAANLAAAAIDLDQHDAGARLVETAQTLFGSISATNGSIYQLAALLLPVSLKPLITMLAYTWPDAKFKSVLAARATMSSASMQLVQQYRQKQQDGAQEAVAAAAAAAGDGSSGGVKRRGGAIAPGSFLGLLLSARDAATGNALSDLQLVMQANTFTMAGYETTANALAFCLFCVATHPEAEARVLAEARAAADQPLHTYKDLEQQFPYTCAVVSEALRLYPPGASTIREVGDSPLALGRYTVPPGSTVFVATYVMQRDPELWPHAQQFLPERWLPGGEHLAAKNPAAYLPFGSGARLCIGSRFALQEVRLGLLELLSKFRFDIQWECMVPPPPQTLVVAGATQQQQQQGQDSNSGVGGERSLKTVNNFTLSPAGGIWVKLERRATAS